MQCVEYQTCFVIVFIYNFLYQDPDALGDMDDGADITGILPFNLVIAHLM